MEENKKGQEAPKKKTVKKVKKEVKVELKDKFVEIIQFIETSIKEERGKQLSSATCARLGSIKQNLQNVVRNLK